MLSLRWHGNRDIRLDDVDEGGPLTHGMIDASVLYCGICGSDVAEFTDGPIAIRQRPHPLSGQAPPVTLGHEFSAVVCDVGPGVESLAPGDRIAADACWRCGCCEACLSGDYNLCPLGGSIGLCSDGGFAPRVRIPAYCAMRLPNEVSDQAGALLEPLAVGLHALTRGGAQAGESVVVLGFGPIGAATAIVGRAIGLNVVVGELKISRQARASHLGFRTFYPEAERRAASIQARELVPGGARIVVDATGSATAIATAIEFTRRGGTVVVAGVPKASTNLDVARLVLFERCLAGTLGYVRDLPRVASLIAAGQLDPSVLVTRIIGLRELPAEFERLATDPGDEIKILADLSL
jgi:(R,R)-butanediol dehydrogenase / meso-butanediol dehydrogenase / diacetyl reductase